MPIDDSTSSSATLNAEFRQVETCVERLRVACENATEALNKVCSLEDQSIVRGESNVARFQKQNIAARALTAKTLKERSKAQKQLLEGFEVLTGSGRQIRDGVENFLADVLDSLAGASGRSPKSFLGSAAANLVTRQVESVIQSLVDPNLSETIDTRLSQLDEFESDLAAFKKQRKRLEDELRELRSVSTGDLESEEKIAVLESELSELDKFISINEGQVKKTRSQLKVVDEAFRKVGSIIELITGTQVEIGSKSASVLSDDLRQAIREIDGDLTELTETIRAELDLALEDSRAVWELYRDTAVGALCAIEDKAVAVGEKVRGILGDASIPGLPDGDENITNGPSGSGARRGGGTGRPITTGGGGRPRQFGGAVGAGLSFLVGERGPEIFVPGRAGSILPNAGGGGFGPSSGGGLGSQIAALVVALDALRAALETVTGAQGDFSDRLIEGQGAAQDFEMRLLSMDAAVQERLGPVLDVINTALPTAQAAVRALEDTTVESVAGAVDALLELTGADEGLRNLVGVIGTELTTALSGNLKTWEDWARFAISAIDHVLGAVQQFGRLAEGNLRRAFHVVPFARAMTPNGQFVPCAA